MNASKPFLREEAHESPGFLLWQVSAMWQRKIAQALKPFDKTQPQFVILASTMWLSQFESEITQIRLAKHTKMDVMTISQVVKGLVEDGLIERKAHSQDTRAKVLSLTKAGIALAKKLIPAVEHADEDFFDVVGEKNKQIIPILNELIQLHSEGGK